MAEERNCIECRHCDGINHAGIGSGEYYLGCCQSSGSGHYVLIHNEREAGKCPHFAERN